MRWTRVLSAGEMDTAAVAKDRPDFLVLGAMRCGTTTLFELLRQHPQIHMPWQKEIPILWGDPPHPENFRREFAKYFQGVDEAKRWGTAPTSYLLFRTIAGPALLRATAPEVRLVAILRNPIDRAVSHCRMWRALRLPSWERSTEEILDEGLTEARYWNEPRPEPHEVPDSALPIFIGEYSRALAPYYRVFPRERLHIMFLEELEKDPQGEFRRLLGFLRVEEAFTPPDLGVHHNAMGDSSRGRGLALRLTSSGPATKVRRSLPLALRTGLARGRMKLAQRDQASPEKKADVSEDLRTALRQFYRADVEKLANQIGRHPPWAEFA